MKACLFGLICLGLAAGPTEAATITTISIDGSRGVYPNGINKNGEISGTYLVGSSSTSNSFVRTPDGDITTFRETPRNILTATAIDAAGNTAGVASRCPRSFQHCHSTAFVRAPDGTLTRFVAMPVKEGTTVPCCIRSDGWIAGSGAHRMKGKIVQYSFIRDPSGNVTLISSLPNCGNSVFATSMNLSDTITGNCSKNDTTPYSGFIRTIDGKYTVFGTDGDSFLPTGIDDKGVVVGYAIIPNQAVVGFTRQTNGNIDTFGVTDGEGTYPMAINSKGAIAGYSSPGGTGHGFVRSPNGRITKFDVPGASSTFATGMNNQGVIIGYYLDEAQTHAYGFVRTP